jgi:glycosyltransferase involved in cell wall biosynthesis
MGRTDANPPRLLFLTPFPPRLDAHHGGGRAVAELISHLSQRHATAVLALQLAAEPPADDALRASCDVFEEIPRPLVGMSPLRLWQQRLRVPLFLSGAPPWAVGCAVSAYRARLVSLLQTWKPDIVQIEYAVMGQYARVVQAFPARRILVDYDTGGRALGGSWARYRRSTTSAVDAVVVLTSRDEESLRSLTGATRLVRIPLGADVPASPLDPVGQSPPSVVFVANYSHAPNAEAARRLARQIVPRVRQRYPELSLYLVGEGAPPDLAGPRVVVTGGVTQVEPYLDRAAIVVVPLSSGGGMRVKVLEALAAGKAVVASRLAIEGLDVVDGEHVRLAESDDQFSTAIVDLLSDPNERAALARRARAWAEDNLGWERSIRAYEALYESLLGSGGPTRAP